MENVRDYFLCLKVHLGAVFGKCLAQKTFKKILLWNLQTLDYEMISKSMLENV